MASERLHLTILSPERKLVASLSVGDVTLTTSEGQIQILPGHSKMVGRIESGIFRYTTDTSHDGGFISTGFFEVDGSSVKVMAETVELFGEIDLERARRAQKKAEEALKEAGIEEAKFKKYQLKLQRSLIRQSLSIRSDSN